MMLQPIGDKQQGEQDAATVASIQRVQTLRKNNPEKTPDELVEGMIRTSCLQVASVGAATAGLAVLPSIRALSMVAGGVLSNLDSTHRLQVELLLDIATVHAYTFRLQERQHYISLALGLEAKGGNTGTTQSSNQSATEQLIAKGGQQLAQRATQSLARKTAGRALPVVGVAKSAGSNVIMTYAAAQRAKVYIQQGPEHVGDMASDISAVLKSDELKLSEWTGESLSDTLMERFDQGAQDVGRAAGRAVRNFRNFWREATTPKS